MEISNQELIAERDAVAPSLGIKKQNMKVGTRKHFVFLKKNNNNNNNKQKQNKTKDTFNKWKAIFDKGEKLPGFFPPSNKN